MALLESTETLPVARTISSTGIDGDSNVVSLQGEQEISTLHTWCEILAGVIAHDDRDVVLDLSEVSFMDAATIGAFVRARTYLELRSRALTLRSPSPFAQRILDLCGLAHLVDHLGKRTSSAPMGRDLCRADDDGSRYPPWLAGPEPPGLETRRRREVFAAVTDNNGNGINLQGSNQSAHNRSTPGPS